MELSQCPPASIPLPYAHTDKEAIEVLLAVLVANFTFALTEKPIVWNVAGVRYPTVGWESNKAEMPMRVQVYRLD